ncbi:hypothetical protein [Saccharothrix obliqua]|uniref:hypothetical protein n=1 Tax=Saccharothrix obliqua TaxID=2861747 RepID=UPI001C5D64D6|nr:hypothetical protein [Saccharothrix obliqua]MBW4718824.1 hypothetical protein [Saccharothrix obliqua]
MVLAISFLEAPLKFRAPGVTVVIGLGIGRIVFRALNTAEVVLAVLVVVAAATGTGVSGPVPVAVAAAVVVLVVQLVAVRPALNRRSDRVLAGEEGPRSRVHLVYVALEVVKVVALVVLGVAAVAAV